MIINHNMNALNAHRNMNVNNTAAGKSMEKLSSGLRINRAGDDAAGLAISEKMRGQIRGLTQASRNASDGISMIQTAEGALNETQNILQRMRELSVQSSNDTNTSEDRASIQKEIEQLTEEIDRIGNNTEFNTQSLLKGDGSTKLEGAGLKMDAMKNGTDIKMTEAKLSLTSEATNASDFKVTLGGVEIDVKVGQPAAGGNATKASNAEAISNQLKEAIEKSDLLRGQFTVSLNTDKVTIEAVKGGKFEGGSGSITVEAQQAANVKVDNNGTALNGTKVTNVGKTEEATSASVTMNLHAYEPANVGDLVGKGFTIGKTQIEFYDAREGAYSGNSVGVDISQVKQKGDLAGAIIDQTKGKIEGASIEEVTNLGNGQTEKGLKISSIEKGANSSVNVEDGAKNEGFEATFQVGANSNQTISISIGDMRAEALGVKNVDLKTAEGSQKATATIQAAIEKVSTERAGLGAVQNRLEYTISNLDNTTENLTSAESTLRDVDMAKEMMTFSKNNILNQAAQAMLAQANQQPQNVLSLLR